MHVTPLSKFLASESIDPNAVSLFIPVKVYGNRAVLDWPDWRQLVCEQGQSNVIRICSATVPKTNLDAPDR